MIRLFHRHFFRTAHYIRIWLFLFPISLFSQNPDLPDTISANVHQDTASTIHTPADPDSVTSSVPHTPPQKTDSAQTATLSKRMPDTSKSSTPGISDTLKLRNGLHFGAGIGWSIGGLDIVHQWKAALTDSLSQYNLTRYSFKTDTSVTDPAYMDTSEIRCVIKQYPEPYNITFPVTLSLVRITDYRTYSFALSFAYFNKTMKSVITGKIDSLSESVNIRHHMRTYSFALSGNYSLPIPKDYFTIEGVERSQLTFSFGCAPQIIQKKGQAEYSGRNERLKTLQKSAEAVLDNQLSVGAGVMARAGITTLHAVNNRSSLEFGVYYTISRFDFFYADGHRLKKGWLNPYSKDKDKHLSYLSGRFEVAVSLLRRSATPAIATQALKEERPYLPRK